MSLRSRWLTRWTVAGCLLAPLQTHAQQFSNYTLVNPPMPTKRYGMAGCGLGSILLPNGPHVLTSIINGLGWNQVFVISSGTSNCQSDPTRQAFLDQEHFMKTNYREIVREAAQGDGETLKALASTLGCSASAQNNFAKFTQKNHQVIFSKPGALAALQTLKGGMSHEDSLRNSCRYAAVQTDHAATE
ncbi:DUF3015 domain-containing protein [bacterium]|nr:DUF3015 domain-containing protein [bacterium]